MHHFMNPLLDAYFRAKPGTPEEKAAAKAYDNSVIKPIRPRVQRDRRAQKAAWRAAHAPRMSFLRARWREAHPEQFSASQRLYVARNPGKVRAWKAAWRARNSEKVKLAQLKWKQKACQSTGENFLDVK